MTRTSVGFDGMDINDGVIYSVWKGVNFGSVSPTLDVYRSYAGGLAEANVSTADRVQMVIPMKVTGTSEVNLWANIEALDTIIATCSAAAPKALIWDGVTFSIITSPRINRTLTETDRGSFFTHVDLVLNRLPATTGTPGGGGGGGWTPPGEGVGSPYNVEYYGAVHNGVTDDLGAIQDGIDWVAANGGGTLYFPPGSYVVTDSIVPAERVCLMGSGPPGITEVGTGTTNASRIVGDGGFAIIEATAETFSFGVERMTFIGSMTDSGSRGIYAHSDAVQVCESWVLRDLFFHGFADQAVFLQCGIAGTFTNIFIEGACYKRADHVTDYVGGFQLGDRTHWFSDAYMEQVASTCSYPATAGGYGDGYICGIALLLTAGFVNSCVGHMSENGWYIFPLSEETSFTGCRADLNQGDGFIIDSHSHRFVNCFSYRGGQDADATYSGFIVHDENNTFVACSIAGIYGDARNQLYGFVDDSGGTNTYVANIANAYISGGLNTPAGSAECYTLNVHAGKLAVCNDGETNYWGAATEPPNTTEGWTPVYIPRSGVIKSIDINWGCSGAMTTENVSLYLRLNGASDTLIETIGDASLYKRFNNAALNIAVTAGWYLQIKNVFPTWATNPSDLYLSGVVYIEAT